MTEALRLQNAARNSMEWFENVKRYIRLEPEQFTYSLLTRSQRVSHENLRLRDPAYLQGVERWFAAGEQAADGGRQGRRTSADVHAVPAARHDARQPRRGGADGHVLRRRRHARGLPPGPSRRACARRRRSRSSRRWRVSLPKRESRAGARGCTASEHVASWRRVVEFVHRHSQARICLQLGHAGPKGSDPAPMAGRRRSRSTTIHGRWSRHPRFATRPPCRCPAR